MKGLLIALSAALVLSACSTQQMYGSAQGWQRNQCLQIADKAEYDRCVASASTDYDSYQRQAK